MGPSGVAVLIGTSGEQGPFLDPEALLESIDGHLECGSPLSQWARRLGCLYREWIADLDAGQLIQGEIGLVVGAIDSWIVRQLPRPLPGVPRTTESVGGVIARVAEASVCADWALMKLSDSPDDALRRHRAWDHFAEMREGYEDLVRQVLAGLIILPKSWPGIGWPGIDVTPRAELPTGDGA